MQKINSKYKYIILVRHGEPNNPKHIVYTDDDIMEKDGPIHITDYGKKQLKTLGKVIEKKKFEVTKIRYSPLVRTVESAKVLNEVLKVKDSKPDPRLKDVYAPGVYLEGLTIDQWKQQKGDAYNKTRWGKYNHENQESIVRRINSIFEDTVERLKLGETAILLSHGDPIAWFVNYKVMGKLPEPKQLRDLIYPNQGQGIVVVLNSKDKIVKHRLLRDAELLKGKSY